MTIAGRFPGLISLNKLHRLDSGFATFAAFDKRLQQFQCVVSGIVDAILDVTGHVVHRQRTFKLDAVVRTARRTCPSIARAGYYNVAFFD